MAAKADKAAKRSKKVASRTSPSGALALLERGIKYLHDKEFRRARACFEEIKQSYPQEREIIARVEGYLQICDSHLAARKHAPTSPEDYYNLGVFKHNQGDYNGAIEMFNEALKHSPKNDNIIYALAASYAAKGDITLALKYLEKAVKLNRQNAILARNDNDFDNLRGLKEFEDIVGAKSKT